jgi:predicted nuclease of predicted toxin-antitoxin system
LLVTFDRDFGELVYRRGTIVPFGIIYLRLSPADPNEAGEVLAKLLRMPELTFEGRFTVVDKDRVRQRPLLTIE